MAYAKHTLGDILLSLSYRYGESAIPSTGIDNRKYWINRGVEFCVDQLKMKKTASVTVVDGTANLSVTTANPAPDFKSVFQLRDSSGNEYLLVTEEEYESTDNPTTARVFCISGSHKDGYVLKAKNDDTYTLWYRFHISPMTATTDECVVPDPEAVVAYAYSQLRMSETDPLEDAEKNMDECRERIAAMAEDLNKNEGDLRFRTLY